MLTLILGMVLGIFFGYREVYKNGEKDLISLLFIPFVCGVFGMMGGAVVALPFPEKRTDVEYYTDLESIQDNTQLNGKFFLGSGHIGEETMYTMYLKFEDGFIFYKVNTYDAIIKYTSGTPRLITIKNERDLSWINLFAIDFNTPKPTYVIEVPKGSILNNYTLDAQ